MTWFWSLGFGKEPLFPPSFSLFLFIPLSELIQWLSSITAVSSLTVLSIISDWLITERSSSCWAWHSLVNNSFPIAVPQLLHLHFSGQGLTLICLYAETRFPTPCVCEDVSVCEHVFSLHWVLWSGSDLKRPDVSAFLSLPPSIPSTTPVITGYLSSPLWVHSVCCLMKGG